MLTGSSREISPGFHATLLTVFGRPGFFLIELKGSDSSALTHSALGEALSAHAVSRAENRPREYSVGPKGL